MSDSDSGVVHAFDQTNGVIAATGEERDGALSGTTSVDTDDVTGSPVAVASGGATVASATDDETTADGAEADDSGSADDDPGAAAEAEPEPATLDVSSDDEAGPDYAPTSDLPLPGDADAADEGAEHTYAVDSAGETTDEGPVATTDDGAYSEAPAVAEWSATDDGRDETTTRAEAVTESSAEPVDDASHTGRLADAYAAGPADEVGGQESEPVDDAPVDDLVVVEEGVVVVDDEPTDDDVVVVEDPATEDDAVVDDAVVEEGPDAPATDDGAQDAAVLAEDSGDGDSRDGDGPGGADRDADDAAATVQEAQAVDGSATNDDDVPAPDSLAALVAEGEGAAHVFDQTNGVVDGLDGTGDGMTEDPGVSRTE